jgi:hypothetical protein
VVATPKCMRYVRRVPETTAAQLHDPRMAMHASLAGARLPYCAVRVQLQSWARRCLFHYVLCCAPERWLQLGEGMHDARAVFVLLLVPIPRPDRSPEDAVRRWMIETAGGVCLRDDLSQKTTPTILILEQEETAPFSSQLTSPQSLHIYS